MMAVINENDYLLQKGNPCKRHLNRKGKVVPPTNDFASQLAALKDKFN